MKGECNMAQDTELQVIEQWLKVVAGVAVAGH